MSAYTIKDSGARQEFAGGMVRDTQEGKADYVSMRLGPMFKRWAAHLTAGRAKYPDVEVGVPNWTLAAGLEEYERARASAARHFEAWLAGERDEDHAAGVFFNINLAEYVLDRLYPGTAPVGDGPHSMKVPFAAPRWVMEKAMGRPQTCCGDPSDCGELCDGGERYDGVFPRSTAALQDMERAMGRTPACGDCGERYDGGF